MSPDPKTSLPMRRARPAPARLPALHPLSAVLLACLAAPAFAQAVPAGTTGETPVAEANASAPEAGAEDAEEIQPLSLDAAERYLDVVGDPNGGDEALALGDYATAIGPASFALGAHSLALGHLATAIGDFSTAIGYGVSSNGLGAVAVGGIALLPESNDSDSAELEMVTTADGEFATAMGPGASAAGAGALALGAGAEATGDLSTAIGLRAQASGPVSTAIGPWSKANGLWATALGASAEALFEDATAIGTGATANGVNAQAFGTTAFASTSALAVGPSARAMGDVSTAVGPGSQAIGHLAIALGAATYADGDRSLSIGFQSASYGDFAIAVGDGATTGGELIEPPPPPGDDEPCWICLPEEDGATAQDIAPPRQATAAVALGQLAQAYSDRSLALGAFSLATGENSVALGAGSLADRDNAVSIGASQRWYGRAEEAGQSWREPLQRQLINLAAGTEAYDAVNVEQLGQFAPVLGGGAYLLDGQLQGPVYQIGGQDYFDIGSAFAAVDARLGELDGAIGEIPAGPPGPPGPPGEPGPGGIGYDDDAGDTLTLEGENGTRVRNVANGTAATDAVNKGQMDAGDAATLAGARGYTDTVAVRTLDSAKAYTDQRFDVLNDSFQNLERQVGARLDRQDKRIDQLGAMSTAMMSMSINAANSRSPRGRIAVGAGWQGGESALSVGYAKSIGRASFSLGGAFTNDESSAGVGFGIDL